MHDTNQEVEDDEQPCIAVYPFAAASRSVCLLLSALYHLHLLSFESTPCCPEWQLFLPVWKDSTTISPGIQQNIHSLCANSSQARAKGHYMAALASNRHGCSSKRLLSFQLCRHQAHIKLTALGGVIGEAEACWEKYLTPLRMRPTIWQLLTWKPWDMCSLHIKLLFFLPSSY